MNPAPANESQMTPANVTPLSPRVKGLYEAAAELSTMMAAIDNGMPIDEAVKAEFQEKRLNVTAAIDRRISASYAIKALLDASRMMRKEADAQVQALKAALKSLKERTKEIMEAFPDDVYVSSSGKRLSVCKNGGQAALVWNFDVRDSVTISNIVDLEVTDFLNVDRKYLKPVTYMTLDTDAIRADLAAGVELDWVKLERGTHVRGLASDKTEESYASHSKN